MPAAAVARTNQLPQRSAKSELSLERRTPARDQVVAGILLAARRRIAGVRRLGAGAPRRLERTPGDLELGVSRAARELFDRVAVAIARREVHRGEVALGAQRLIDEADALEEAPPNRWRTCRRMLVITLRTVTFAAPCS